MNLLLPDSNLVSALNHSSDLIAISNFESHFTQLNQKWEEVTGYTIDELTSKPLFEFIHPEDREMSQNEAQDMYNGKPETIKFENRYIKKNGEVIWLEWNSVINYDLKLNFSIAREITDQKAANLFGNQAKELMAYLVGYANDLPENNDYFESALSRLLDLYGVDCVSFWDFTEEENSIYCRYSKEKKGVKSRTGLTLSRKSANAYFEAILNNKLVIASDVMLNPNTSDLTDYFKEYYVTSLLDGIVNQGLSKCVLCIESSTKRTWTNQESNVLLAITNIISNFLNNGVLLNANNELREALEEKKILFKELHHRIKNNLNMVASLLSLKSRISNTPELSEFVKETKNRIYSISKTHDQLLKLEELDKLNVREYIIDLVQNVVNTYTTKSSLYPIVYEVENHSMKVDLVLSIGLLTNEIVSNIIKYAYDPKIGGEIHVRFKKNSSGYRFEIGDRGKGLQTPAGDSLGLTLIDLLVKQINGSLETITNKGVIYNIKIPFR